MICYWRLARTALLLIILTCCRPVSGQSLEQTLHSAVDRYAEEDAFAGVVLVARNDNILLEDGWGLANRSWNEPNEPDTRFRLGSMTKSFTATAVMRLVQDGRIGLDDPIGQYIRDLPDHIARSVTVGHLLSHTSGLNEFYRIPDFNRLWLYEPPGALTILKAVARHPLEFEPGSTYAYRNIGYLALGLIIERVTETTYDEAVKTLVLDPAEMQHSGVERQGLIIENMAHGYAQVESGWQLGSYLNPSLLQAAGGMVATARDVFRFSRALDTSRILDASTREMMFTPRIKELGSPGSRRHYALGWHIDRIDLDTAPKGIQIMEHGGDVTSFESLLTLVPSLDVVIVILHNHGETDQNTLRNELIEILHETMDQRR